MMGTFIIKLERGDSAWYMEWSTAVDGPGTYGMPLDKFRKYYQEEYGLAGMRDLDGAHGIEGSLARVEATGTSLQFSPETAETAINGNVCGEDGEALTFEQIIDRYCVAPTARVNRAEAIQDVIEAQEAQKADAAAPKVDL